MELPLSAFSHNTDRAHNSEKLWPPQYKKLQGAPLSSPDLIQLSDTDGVSQLESMSDSEVNSSQHKSDSPDSEHPRMVSPSISSTASDSPTPTNSMAQEKTWASAHWQGLIGEEHRQLLGTEEESSDRHSSDEDYDVWTVTDEQREYYTAQFRSLQPDLRGRITGSVAKNFFEKSKLPVQELRKIWQLADVTKDGALSLKEFYAAMHLVVLRRNNIELPDTLPPSLAPISQRHSAGSLQDQQDATSISEGSSPPTIPPPELASPQHGKEWTKFADSPTSNISSPGPKPVNFDFQKSVLEQDPKILHPVAVRLTPESNLQQTNEDESSSHVPHRKASDSATHDLATSDQHCNSPKKSMLEQSELRPIQRPQPKKPAAPGPGAIPPPPPPATNISGNHGDVASSSGPTSLPLGMGVGIPMTLGPRKEAPPPPPPRPYRSHARSSSLDLNRIGRGSGLLNAPPAVPPRVSPCANSPKRIISQKSEGEAVSLPAEALSNQAFADFNQFPKEGPRAADFSRKHGAFEVYRKPASASTNEVPQQQDDSPDGAQKEDLPTFETGNGLGTKSRDQRSLLASIQQLKLQNSALLQLNQELAAELAKIKEERILLEKQVEHMKMHNE